jgi:hypothetical protein
MQNAVCRMATCRFYMLHSAFGRAMA